MKSEFKVSKIEGYAPNTSVSKLIILALSLSLVLRTLF